MGKMICNLPKEEFLKCRRDIRRNICLNSELLHNYRERLEGCSVLMGGIVVERKDYVELPVVQEVDVAVSQLVPRGEVQRFSADGSRTGLPLNATAQVSLKLFDCSGFFSILPSVDKKDTRIALASIWEGDLIYILGKVLGLPGLGAVLLPCEFFHPEDVLLNRAICDDEFALMKRDIAERIARPADLFSAMSGYMNMMEVVRPFLKRGQELEGDKYYWLLDIIYEKYLISPSYDLAYSLFKMYRKVYCNYASREDFLGQYPETSAYEDLLFSLSDQ